MTTKNALSPGETMLSQPPVGEWLATSGPSRQACQVRAQRSAAEQPAPVELGLSFPATRSQLGLRDDVASNPGKFQPPAQPAMFGQFSRSRKPSRVPSEQPTIAKTPMTGVTSAGWRASPRCAPESLAHPPNPSTGGPVSSPPESEGPMPVAPAAVPSVARPAEKTRQPSQAMASGSRKIPTRAPGPAGFLSASPPTVGDEDVETRLMSGKITSALPRPPD